ncbi:hypothetical protein PUV54_00150 [Hyphococcus flavus]|uniref:HNH endonuclease n=1 Tax=Hyphococcus flavus TaxID=1866326 RepID=A0AAF0CFN5_9PROT|nr:hypothetical protein [Hyphococcus flavus]WDI31604.1 hypothetical protein PUV54_00150 [Hyphococcus flavus]
MSSLAKREAQERHDAERGSAHERGYDARWAKASKEHGQREPLCQYSKLDGVVAARELTDHLYPHCGNRELFWMRDYWVSSTKAMHDGFKARIESDGIEAIDQLAIRLGKQPLREVRPELADHVARHLSARARRGGGSDL